MTITVTTQKIDGSQVIECFNCHAKEQSKWVGMQIQWNTFDTQSGGENQNIICLTCGHSHPRKSLGLAKYKHLDTVHLCLVYDGDSFAARCGMMTASISANKDIEELKEIQPHNKMCKKCAREEGVSLYNNKGWYSDEDKELEFKFYRHL